MNMNQQLLRYSVRLVDLLFYDIKNIFICIGNFWCQRESSQLKLPSKQFTPVVVEWWRPRWGLTSPSQTLSWPRSDTQSTISSTSSNSQPLELVLSIWAIRFCKSARETQSKIVQTSASYIRIRSLIII